MLKIHNSLAGAREPFRPIEAGKVRIYVCGITVYDYCHLGHARMLVVFDMVTRYLRERNFDVTYVRNITDIDDKIIKRAAENKESVESLTERFIQAMNEDAGALHVLKPDQEPRATGHIDHIIDMIEKLVANGLAYQADNGDVFYNVSEFREYGRLSGKKLDELRAGARVDVSEAKDDPLDFVLWKVAKEGEPSWDSPWGPGRPGWHIECSAMSTHCLGDHFDIHGGGQDLQFPHHENEIAQSVGATAFCYPMDAQRLCPDRRGKNVQVPGQFLYRAGNPAALSGGSRPFFHPLQSLPQSVELFRRDHERGPRFAGPAVYRPARCERRRR